MGEILSEKKRKYLYEEKIKWRTNEKQKGVKEGNKKGGLKKMGKHNKGNGEVKNLKQRSIENIFN